MVTAWIKLWKCLEKRSEHLASVEDREQEVGRVPVLKEL